MRKSIFTLTSAAAIFAALIAPANDRAHAADAGALAGCDADDIGGGQGFIPPAYRDEEYLVGGLQTGAGNYSLLCGDGTTRGAVHIQVKHAVTDWVTTQACIANVLERGTSIPQTDRLRYEWSFPGGSVVVAIGPDPRGTFNQIYTAFPEDGQSGTWSSCAAV